MDTFSAADTLGIINHGNTIFIVCNSLKKNKWITYITLIVTILTKLFLDMLRYDHLRILITPNQIASIGLLVIVIAVYIYNFAKSLKV